MFTMRQNQGAIKISKDLNVTNLSKKFNCISYCGARDIPVTFTPALSATKRDAMDAVDFPPSIKVFLRFSEMFYPKLMTIGSLISLTSTTPTAKTRATTC